MATYASYKTLTADNFQDNSITAAKLGAGAVTNIVYNGFTMNVACIVKHVQMLATVANKQMVSVVTGQFQLTLQKQYSKFGQVEAQVQVVLVVVTVSLQQVDQAVTTQ